MSAPLVPVLCLVTLATLLTSWFARGLAGFADSEFGAIPFRGGFWEEAVSAPRSLSMEVFSGLLAHIFELDWGESVREVTGFCVVLLEWLYFLLMKSPVASE